MPSIGLQVVLLLGTSGDTIVVPEGREADDGVSARVLDALSRQPGETVEQFVV